MITLEEAARATGGAWLAKPLSGETPLLGGAFDTRDLGRAEMFFALEGDESDGHRYLARLNGSGVKLAVVHHPVPMETMADNPGLAVLQTGNTLKALADMAAYVVEKYRPRVVAVTGSYGKTTTKEIIAHVLSGAMSLLKTPGSLNNEIGVPITLLSLEEGHQAVVLEFSARKPGDIETLGRIAAPHVAVLLNVGRAHIGVFGSQQAIFETKGEIFNHLAPKGLALVGAEEPRLRQLAAGRRVLTFGREGGDFHAERITLDGEGRQRFDGVYEGVRLALHSGVPGPRGCEPVLAAWAVARELGVSDAVVAERAGQPPDQKGRLRLFRAPGGAVVIDDAYNASPETVVNLIETLNDRPERVKVVVLGPLAELEEGLAESAARIAGSLGPPLSRCIVHDPVSSQLFDGLERAGIRVALQRTDSQADLFAALKALDAPDTVVGIKGSRSAHMERAVQAMLGTQVACRLHPCALLRYCTDCDDLTGI